MLQRNATSIALAILKLIPSESEEFRKDLKTVIDLNNSVRCPPEGIVSFDDIYAVLIKHMPAPVEDYEFEIASLFSTTPVETLRKMK